VDQSGQVLLLFDGGARFASNSVAGIWITNDGFTGESFSAMPFKYVNGLFGEELRHPLLRRPLTFLRQVFAFL